MRKYIIGALLAGAASLIVAGPALAKGNGGQKPGLSFFAAQDATAGWAPNKSAVVLSETTTAGAYAGAVLKGVGASAPTAAPTFQVTSNTDEASGGSPRLVIEFSDGGNIDGYYLTMNGTNPSDMQWDSTVSGYNVGYAQAVADHGSATVTSVFLVTDSGWLGTDYTNTITSVVYGADTFAG